MHILQVVTSDFDSTFGGLETYCRKIDIYRNTHKFTVHRFSRHRIGVKYLNSIYQSLNLFRYIIFNYRKFDLVECHFIPNGILLPLTSRFLPYVIFFHSPWGEEMKVARSSNNFWLKFRDRLERVIVEKSLGVLTPGIEMSYHLKEISKNRKNVIVVGAGVETVIEESGKEPFSPNRPFRVFCIRRHVERMGIEDLISAWSLISPQGNDLLVIGGQGPLTDSYKQLSRDLETNSIEFTGTLSQEELHRQYVSASVTVVPTRELEGFGLVVLESWATGTHVISSDSGELKHLVGGRFPESVFKAYDFADLAATLQKFRDGLIQCHEPMFYKRIAGEFTWQKCANRIDNGIEELMADRLK